jgi:hypothetical protein
VRREEMGVIPRLRRCALCCAEPKSLVGVCVWLVLGAVPLADWGWGVWDDSVRIGVVVVGVVMILIPIVWDGVATFL